MLSARESVGSRSVITSVPVTTPISSAAGSPGNGGSSLATSTCPPLATARGDTPATQCSVPAGADADPRTRSSDPTGSASPSGTASSPGATTAGTSAARRNDCATSNSSAMSSRHPQLPSLAAFKTAAVSPSVNCAVADGSGAIGPTRDTHAFTPPWAKNACTA